MHHSIFLVEDISGETTLKIVLNKIGLNTEQYEIHSYRGIGKIPENLNKSDSNPKKRQLLTQLPKLLKGFSTRYQYLNHTIFVLCDLDKCCFKKFREELLEVAKKCDADQHTQFFLSVNEMEAWFLGDFNAIKKIYSRARRRKNYTESKLGCWETLADSIKKGWSKELKKQKEKEGYSVIGKLKNQWATEITPHLNIQMNSSPCFCYFRDKIQKIIQDDNDNK
ncbi:MAG: DUF4276 family protein [Planctomycetaceae bacterium]|jgi:hypothetical protein|nr:DUF4276 family protein [Planctomycetaceae bacterium]